MAVDITDPKFIRKEIIPEDKDALLDSVDLVNGDTFVVVYKKNVSKSLYTYFHFTDLFISLGYRRTLSI